jgi:uncharacterized protein YkwD
MRYSITLLLSALALAFVASFSGSSTALAAGNGKSSSASHSCTASSSWGVNDPALAGQVLVLLNKYRVSHGFSALRSNSTLRRTAQWKSLNMSGKHYFEHNDTPLNRPINQRFSDCGYSVSSGWGENIAYGYGSAEQVMQAWIHSPEHLRNIRTPWFKTVGVGVAHAADGTIYWTQDFGGK